MEKKKGFLSRFITVFNENQLNISAAALSYYITMTFFPLIICMYTLLGNNYDMAVSILELLEPIIPGKAFEYTMNFMDYVSGNYSVLMMLLAVSIIVVTASAGFRSLEVTIGRMQGHFRYEAFGFFISSVLLSLGFTFMMYLGIVIMFLGNNILTLINSYIPFIDLENTFLHLRYLLLFAVGAIVIFSIFEFCKSREDNYSTIVGALISTGLLVGVSAFFSIFISASIKYPLVYSSLGSIIILMFWLYSSCTVIYCGAAINIVLRDMKKDKNNT